MRFDDNEFQNWADEPEVEAKEPTLKEHLDSQETPYDASDERREYIAIAPPLVLCMLPETPEYACPNCMTSQVFGIIVKMKDADLGVCFGYYQGCACCEWSSMISISDKARRDWDFKPEDR